MTTPMTARTLLAGRYELLSRIGHGGMGQVWRAHDRELRRDVAVKTVDISSDGASGVAERFRREAVASAALSHPNIVTVFDGGTDGAIAYLVMALLHGRTAAELLAEGGPLPLERALDLTEQAAAGVGAAHRVGIVHRDLKPANLFVEGDVVRVLDFGIAQLIGHQGETLTAADAVMGTASYLAPEQARGDRATERSDVYALGCVLYALLTGRAPYTSEHPIGLLHQHLEAPVPLVGDLRPDVPPAVQDLVARMMAKEPGERPSDGDHVRAELAGLRSDDGVARPVLAAAPAAVVPADTEAISVGRDDEDWVFPDPAEGGSRADADHRRRRPVAWFAAAAAITLLGVLAVLQLGPRDALPLTGIAAPPESPVASAPADPPRTTTDDTAQAEPTDPAVDVAAPPPEAADAAPAEQSGGRADGGDGEGADGAVGAVTATEDGGGGTVTPPEPAPEPTPAPTTQAPSDNSAEVAAAVDGVRSAIDGAQYGDRAAQTRGELNRAVDAVVRRIEQDRPADARADLDAAQALVSTMVTDGRITGGSAAIDSALANLGSAADLP
ncbi:serine/threonine protein kinase [Occultella glacieicola]|uniref:non-specific serine/threonine protein kinase n=1 Tax=Occultella glacieicola TaxID=2518684 RepID=A0ABY2E7B3_9MICO|nr:serine/threonine-protein kinase [Occultella glacieicola]TDE97445.1 serine/threonine protein kinase [Occultella glacieicola]